jgi:hypothetical protein
MIIIDFFNVFYLRCYDLTFENFKAVILDICACSIKNNSRVHLFIDGYKFSIDICSKYRKLIAITYAYHADDEIIKFINSKPAKSFLLVTADRNIINETKLKIFKLIHPRDFLKKLYKLNHF